MQLSNRSLALDVFRGMTVCFMIIVNTPEVGVLPMHYCYAHWNGLRQQIWYFLHFFCGGQFYEFCDGQMAKYACFKVLTKIFKRTFIIFLLGYLMYWFPFYNVDEQFNIKSFPFDQTRVFGVLQRIALCYGWHLCCYIILNPKFRFTSAH
jgi:predicted acyltransferase